MMLSLPPTTDRTLISPLHLDMAVTIRCFLLSRNHTRGAPVDGAAAGRARGVGAREEELERAERRVKREERGWG
eukprot:3229878-Rhodomonas_salina.3